MIYHNLILGEQFSDDRGALNFFNAFDMSEIKRFYQIEPVDEKIIRAWQGHRHEKKWFYCNQGSFVINLIAPDNFETPSKHIEPEKILLQAKEPAVLELSGGYITGFKASEKKSKLMVFSNFDLEDSKKDDYRYDVNTWSANWSKV